MSKRTLTYLKIGCYESRTREQSREDHVDGDRYVSGHVTLADLDVLDFRRWNKEETDQVLICKAEKMKKTKE